MRLPGYSNVAPSLSLSADVEEREAWRRVTEQLTIEVQRYVKEQIDIALEEAGQPPKFCDGPRYTLLHWRNTNALVIVPDEKVALDDLPGDWEVYEKEEHAYHDDAPVYRHHRRPVLRQMVKDLGEWAAEIDVDLAEWAWREMDGKWTALDVNVDLEQYQGFLGEVIVPCAVWREWHDRGDAVGAAIVRGAPIGARERLEVWRDGRRYSTDQMAVLETVEQFVE